MIGTIRRHSNVLWYFIIVAVIVSFVIYFTPGSKLGGGLSGDEYDYGTMYGRRVTRAEYMTAQKEVELRFFLTRHQWIPSGTKGLDEETRQRIVLIENLKRKNIRADDASVARQIRALFQRDENGVGFEQSRYKQFVKAQLEPNGVTEEDLFEYIRHDLGQAHLRDVMGMPGRLAAERGAEVTFSNATLTVDAEVAFFSRSNFLDSVKMDPAAVTNYYSQRIEEYAIPRRMQLTYVFFSETNYLADADKILAAETNLNQNIDRVYVERGTNAFKDGTNTLTEAAAKARIKEDYRREKARDASLKAATDFANKLYRMKPLSSTNLAVLAATNSLKVLETRPFPEDRAPSEIETEELITKTVWELNESSPFSVPITGAKGTYLLAYEKLLAREYPPLEVMKARVTEDYRRTRAQELTMEAGMAFVKAATNGLAQGKSFKDICAADKITPISVFSVSRQTVRLEAVENRVDLSTFKDATLDTPVGKVSPYRSSRDGGFVIYVSKVIPTPESRHKEDFPKYVEEYRDDQQNIAYAVWFRHELMQSGMMETKPKARAAK